MKNVGFFDQVIRITIGIALIAMVFVGPKTPWGYIGIIFILTAITGFCPLYKVLKINSCKIDRK